MGQGGRQEGHDLARQVVGGEGGDGVADQQDAEEREEEQSEQPLRQEGPEITQTLEVAEHVREEDEAPDPERADQPGDGRRAERAAADDVPEGEETRLQQRDDRHGVSSPSAALTMSRKTASSDAGSGPPSP